MATINISDLHPTGSDLFYDSESYMNELGDGELDATYGGASPAAIAATIIISGLVTSHAWLLYEAFK